MSGVPEVPVVEKRLSVIIIQNLQPLIPDAVQRPLKNAMAVCFPVVVICSIVVAVSVPPTIESDISISYMKCLINPRRWKTTICSNQIDRCARPWRVRVAAGSNGIGVRPFEFQTSSDISLT